RRPLPSYSLATIKQEVKTELQAKHLINIDDTKCPPETDEAFNKWYDEDRIPANMKFKGLDGVTRYKLASSGDLGTKTQRAIKVKEYPNYLTFYYFKDIPTAEVYDISPECVGVRYDWENVQKESGALHLWRGRYEPLKTWQK
ncbi:hypothetical protein ACFLVN_06370, partial [Chloroflexota bacterium]